MPGGYPAGTLSALKPLLACALTLCGLIGYHLLLPPLVRETGLPVGCPQPCCAYKLPAGAPLLSGVQFAGSSEK